MSLKQMKQHERGSATATVQRRDFALALGVGINVVVIWGLTSPAETPTIMPANDIAAVFADPVSLPQAVELAYGELQPPANDTLRNDAAKGAIWKYLCTRTPGLSNAAGAPCPAFDMGSIGLGALTPPPPGEDDDSQKLASESTAGAPPEEGQLW